MWKNEAELEAYIRRVITSEITKHDGSVYCLHNKKAVDIVICRDGKRPALFFFEVKYHRKKNGRLGFGVSKGRGFQPEIVQKNPAYFEKNLRWIIGSESLPAGNVLMVKTSEMRPYLSGGGVGLKYNNIQSRIFNELPSLSRTALVSKLKAWIL